MGWWLSVSDPLLLNHSLSISALPIQTHCADNDDIGPQFLFFKWPEI